MNDNPGKSVTNAAVELCTAFCKEKGLNLNEVLFIERYDAHPDDLDWIILREHKSGERYVHATWRRLHKEEARPILEALQ